MDNKKRLDEFEVNNEQSDEDIYARFNQPKKEEDVVDESNNSSDVVNNTANVTNSEEDKKNESYLESHTVVTKASKLSRVVLFGFYALVLVVGVIVFLLIRSDRYEFYIVKDEVTLNSGSTYQVELTPKNIRYFDYLNYKYTMEDESIAKVDEFGTITGVGNGTTTLKISISPGLTTKTMKVNSVNTEINSIDLKVYNDQELLEGNSVTLMPNQSNTLVAVANKNEEFNTSVEYKSSNPSVVSVDPFGNVTAVGEGRATITGTGSGKSGEIEYIVETEPSSSTSSGSASTKVSGGEITINSTNLTITKGKTATFSITVSGAAGMISVVSKNTSVASVSSTNTNCNGSSCFFDAAPNEKATITYTVSGVTAGSTTIDITYDDVLAYDESPIKGSKQISVKVNNPAQTSTETKVTKVDIGTSKVTKYVGESISLSPTITPAKAVAKSVKWESSNTSVATVDDKGVVKTLKKGTAIITVTIDGIKDQCTIIVKEKETTTTTTTTTTEPPKGTQISGNEINLSKTSLTVGKGKTATFDITVTGVAGMITVTSSNTKIATVSVNNSNCNGNSCFLDAQPGETSKLTYTVTGVANGTAYINVSLEDMVSYDEKEIKGSGKVGILVQ